MTLKRTIAHVVYSFGSGGIENGIVNLVNRLPKDRYAHLICCLTQSGVFEQRLNGSNCKVVELKKRDGNDIAVPFELGRLFRTHLVDIVHLRGWPTLIEGVAGGKMAGKRAIIYGFHGKTFTELRRTKPLRKLVERIGVRCVQQILTLSGHMRDDFCRRMGVGKRQVAIIHNGVDTDKFRPDIDAGDLMARFGLSPGDLVVGSVGRLDAVKDYCSLIQGFQRFQRIVRRARLLIVGDGPERASLEQAGRLAGLQGRILFTGFQSDIPGWLNAMDIYVQTSLYEGFSNTLIEAMATGLPVVTTDVGGNATIVEDRINGFLIQPKNPEMLCDRLLRLADDRDGLAQISRTNRKRIIDHFSLHRMVESYDSLYRSLCTRTPGRGTGRKPYPKIPPWPDQPI